MDYTFTSEEMQAMRERDEHAPCKEAGKKMANMYAEMVAALTAAQEEAQRTRELLEQEQEARISGIRKIAELRDLLRHAQEAKSTAENFQEQAQKQNAKLRETLKNVMPMVNAYYRTFPDDGVQQDYLMTEVIEPARAALEA